MTDPSDIVPVMGDRYRAKQGNKISTGVLPGEQVLVHQRALDPATGMPLIVYIATGHAPARAYALSQELFLAAFAPETRYGS